MVVGVPQPSAYLAQLPTRTQAKDYSVRESLVSPA